ncbi:MAG: YggT family protein [Pseudomonadota bacterium]|nr:YggT family protein [Pseudomonadota bacterium]
MGHYFSDALLFLSDTLIGLYLLAVLLRFLFPLLRVDFRNPLVQMVVTVTDPPLRLLRRFVPGLFGIDVASLLLILLLGLLKLYLRGILTGIVPSLPAALVLTLAEVLNTAIWIFLAAVFLRAVLSWFSPSSYHPAIRLLQDFTEPLMAPARRLLPAMGGLDLSPIVVLIALSMAQKLLVNPLYDLARSLL